MSTPRKNPKKTDPKQLTLNLQDREVHIHVHFDLAGLLREAGPAVPLPVSVPPPPTAHVHPDKGVDAVPPKAKRAKSTKGGALRSRIRDHVNILAYQSRMDQRTVWLDAYKELQNYTGLDAIYLSSFSDRLNHLDVVEAVNQLDDLFHVITAMRRSPAYNPSALV